MKAGKAWRYRLEAAGAWFGFLLFRLLPFHTASNLGGWLARTIGPKLKVSDVARNNLRIIMPQLSGADVEHIVTEVWDNIGRNAAEMPHMNAPDVLNRVTIQESEHLRPYIGTGRGCIVVSAHFGNWEIGALCLHHMGMKQASVYRPANNPHVDRLITRIRASYNEEQISKLGKGLVELVRRIRRGGNVIMLNDQKLNTGISLPFFGHDCMTAPLAASMAIKYGVPLLPARVIRREDDPTRFIATVYPPILPVHTGNHDADERALLMQVHAHFESWIRERPGHWFWLHKRWPWSGRK